MARMAGVSESRIRNMRQDGLSWGNIAADTILIPTVSMEDHHMTGIAIAGAERPQGWQKREARLPALKRKAVCPPDRQKKCIVMMTSNTQ